MLKRVLVGAALVGFGCATQSGTTTKPAEATPQLERMAVSNVIPFDIAACGPRTLSLEPMNSEVLAGALLSMSPAFQECLIDPKNLDVDAGVPQVKLKSVVTDSATVTVSGTGLTEAGKQCLVDQARKIPVRGVPAGSKPAEQEIPVSQPGKPVVFGLNTPSDVVGAIRLAQTSMCSCYAEIGTNPPPVLVARIKLYTDKPAEVGMEPSDSPAVSQCVQGKIAALSFPQQLAEVPYQFLLKNSYATGATAAAQPALQFQQLDGIRAQRLADVFFSAGKRVAAAEAYDAVVAAYKAKKTPSLISELRTKCAAVVSADDAWLGSLNALVGVFEQSRALVTAEAAKDTQWTAVSQALDAQEDGTKKEIARVEQQKAADQGACPKSK